MTNQHTPGPWHYDEVWGLIKANDGTEIAALHSGIKANGYLVKAAPEMLEALEESLNVLQNDLPADLNYIVKQIHRAINKAKGL